MAACESLGVPGVPGLAIPPVHGLLLSTPFLTAMAFFSICFLCKLVAISSLEVGFCISKGLICGQSSSGKSSGVPSTEPHVNMGWSSSTPGAGEGVSMNRYPPTAGDSAGVLATCLGPSTLCACSNTFCWASRNALPTRVAAFEISLGGRLACCSVSFSLYCVCGTICMRLSFSSYGALINMFNVPSDCLGPFSINSFCRLLYSAACSCTHLLFHSKSTASFNIISEADWLSSDVYL
mmetsp:Transcript_11365/g.17879  ORF Transcript_11365/g.17879 Transcript_11365/m.17879 type:complete len:237 (-) Transcript_11365:35-745(-)